MARGNFTKRYGEANNNYKHGLRKTRLFRIWSNMKTRCTNPNTCCYKYYGGKGVTICNEWMNDFKHFYDWSMCHGYTDELSLDRIDYAGNYEPDNCRWVTNKTQANNKSDNRYVTRQGITLTLKEWCEIEKINYRTVQDRLKRGWDIEKALVIAPAIKFRRKDYVA